MPLPWRSNQIFRCFTVLALFFTFFSPRDSVYLAADELETPVTLVYLYTKGTPSIPIQEKLITITIQPHRTIINCAKETFLIVDYQRGIVFHQKPGKKEPQQYVLKPVGFNNSNPTSFSAVIEAKLASLQSIDRLIGDTVQIKELWFGYELSRMRTAVPITQSHFGRIFSERRLRCQVSRDVDQFDILVQIAKERQSMVAANPLLFQLDPVNLIPVLEGLPVRVWEAKENETHSYVLQQDGGEWEKCNQSCGW